MVKFPISLMISDIIEDLQCLERFCQFEIFLGTNLVPFGTNFETFGTNFGTFLGHFPKPIGIYVSLEAFLSPIFEPHQKDMNS